MESLNRTAIELVDEAIDFAPELGVTPHELENGATVIDFGVEAEGGIEAGLLLAEIATAGLATVQSRGGDLAGTPRPYVEVTTDHADLALLCSGKAGWELSVGDFEGLGGGPARALVAREDVFEQVGYRDDFELAALTVESDDLPDEAVAEHVADLAGVDPGAVYLPTVRTGSVAGSVLGAARAAELAVFQLLELGYHPRNVVSATGSAPMAPVAGDELTAIGRTNDAVAYGGRVHLTVREDFEEFDAVPSQAAGEYDAPFATILGETDPDPETLGPAQVTVDVVGGRTVTVGEVHEDLLAESFGL